jgi:hypothetical protein
MKNTVAGASFTLASIVCIVMYAKTYLMVDSGNVYYPHAYFATGFLLIAWFVNVCLGIYYFNAEDKTDS